MIAVSSSSFSKANQYHPLLVKQRILDVKERATNEAQFLALLANPTNGEPAIKISRSSLSGCYNTTKSKDGSVYTLKELGLLGLRDEVRGEKDSYDETWDKITAITIDYSKKVAHGLAAMLAL